MSKEVKKRTQSQKTENKILKTSDEFGNSDRISSRSNNEGFENTVGEKSSKLENIEQLAESAGTKNAATHGEEDLRGSYWLTRIVIIRYLGFLYSVAYLVSLHQNKQLLGRNGLLPANLFLSDVRGRIGSSNSWSLMTNVPTLLWFVDYDKDLNYWLDAIAWMGLGIAIFMVVTGAGNWPLMLFQWLLYHSLVNVGQRWAWWVDPVLTILLFSDEISIEGKLDDECDLDDSYLFEFADKIWFSFGWESQLLETGFLATFLCPMLSLSAVPRATPPSKIVIFAYRWLIFRIMLGAGLIKIRGDKCWRNLTCMHYHYETQPVPNPLSYFMHQSPEFFHKFEVLSNHFVELMAPGLLLLTRRLCMMGGAIQILFQVVLIISGNLSFLNWLTILPSIACFDDASLSWMFSTSVKTKVLNIRGEEKAGRKLKPNLSGTIRRVFNISLGLLLAYLSIPVVQNLLSSRQAMNTSFDPLRLVNTYGAFGSVTKKRMEVVIQGTNSSNPDSPTAKWEEYQFHCKPGDIYRRPCLISPYHYRLDWLMWFAAFQDYQNNPWLLHMCVKLLVNDENMQDLIAHNPFRDLPPPKFIRAEHYRYTFTKLGSPNAKEGAWWKRKHVGGYLQPVSLKMLSHVISSMGWPEPKQT